MQNETTQIASVFHQGELSVQQKAGVSGMVAQYATKAIRPFMPDQHREFYTQLPMIMLGLIDHRGRPWATAAFGAPGFITSPDKNTLVIDGHPLFADALTLQTNDHNKIGLLGIEPETRRRNRMNGYIERAAQGALHIHVDQSFGNCPQYIQRRDMTLKPAQPDVNIQYSQSLGAEETAFIHAADTFFIASRSANLSNDPTSGVDVSHRGGRQGFVKVEDNGTLSFPDFSGNRFFNTLGNIASDGRVGLFFPDFQTGDAVFITGRGEIRWDDPRINDLKGAERIINITPEKIVSAAGALPIAGAFVDQWPNLKNTGVW